MQIFYNSYPPSTPSAVALGNFDGVHIGHTRLIKELTSKGVPSTVYTFESHPLNVIKGKGTVPSINTNSEKAELFHALGVDNAIFADFNQVRGMSPQEFVDEILIGKLNACEVVCGYNYRFGKNGVGDTELLSSLLEGRGVKLTVIDEVTLDGKPVSSTQVRKALSSGDMEMAERLLGRPFFIDSTVVHGKALGRQLGFPTVNEAFVGDRLILPYGVYFARCTVKGGASYSAVVNVGVRPTVNSTDPIPTVEAHLIDFKGDLYGTDVRIELLKKSRDEQKFGSLDDLKKQIEKDICECREYFNER
ncbi:MAG: bifunctional riboflavin kinase/FAD synthetase [Clostridia bacterium]|nr:bifunctional riboflavin kinase/FAD synthetase [Clostridia bacterium]